jgi:hypothetical protein
VHFVEKELNLGLWWRTMRELSLNINESKIRKISRIKETLTIFWLALSTPSLPNLLKMCSTLQTPIEKSYKLLSNVIFIFSSVNNTKDTRAHLTKQSSNKKKQRGQIIKQ